MHILKAEMGQHIGTGLAQIIAEELEVKWDDVQLDTPLESVENFAIYGLAYTVNSGSITTEFDRLSRAGAAGRIALIEAGAKVLGAKPADCYAENSRVIDEVGPLDRLRRDPAEGEDRPQVRLPGRLQENQAQDRRRVQDHRQVDPGDGHSGEDQRPGQVRHGCVPAEHGRTARW